MSFVLAIWTIGGLPAHPLLVHAATVLVALAAVAALVVAFAKPGARRTYAGPLAAVCLGLLVITQLTVMTGEQLAEATGEEREIEDHEEAGEMARNLLAVLTLALAGLAFVERREAGAGTGADSALAEGGASESRRSVLTTALRVGAGAAAVATLGMTIQAGHTGAWAVWHEESLGGEGSGEGDDTGDD